MKIDGIRNIYIPEFPKIEDTGKSSGVGFQDVLTEFVGGVNQDQINSSKITNEYITGGNVELHEVMIAGEKAKTSLELLMEIRNKTVDMYKELTRIPV